MFNNSTIFKMLMYDLFFIEWASVITVLIHIILFDVLGSNYSIKQIIDSVKRVIFGILMFTLMYELLKVATILLIQNTR